MRLTESSSFSKKGNYTIEQAVIRQLDGSDYERGQVETAQAEASNCSEYLAKLTSLLFDSNILKKQDLKHLLPGYEEL